MSHLRSLWSHVAQAILLLMVVAAGVVPPTPAHAAEMNTLQIPSESPWWVHAGAALILWLHIGGGTISMISGSAALVVRKGSPAHRLLGNFFFVSMLIMLAIGAVVSPFLTAADGSARWFDALGAVFALYLVATAWATVRRPPGKIGRFEIGACVFALLAAAGSALIGIQAANAPRGEFGGYGAMGYYVIAGLLTLAAALDLNVILRGGVKGVPRLSRHIWRMCVALFVALGAFFFGQQRFLPEAVQGSALVSLAPLVPLGSMIFWLLKVRFAKALKVVTRSWGLRRERAAAG